MSREPRPMRRQVIQMTVFAVIAAIVGTIIALTIHWFPTTGSTQLKKISDLYDLLLLVSVPIFVLVQSVVIFCVWRFRMRPGEEEMDGPPIHGNTRLEIVWTAIPAILLVALCSYAYVVLRDLEKKKSGEMVVKVTGQQFAWTFEYPGVGGKPLRTNQLYLEAGKPVVFHIRSVDVIHDFWVPQFGMKIDAVPGITTRYRITPNRTGEYTVVCAELCGIGHATMRQSAHVLGRQQFANWMASQQNKEQAPAPVAGDTVQAKGGNS